VSIPEGVVHPQLLATLLQVNLVVPIFFTIEDPETDSFFLPVTVTVDGSNTIVVISLFYTGQLPDSTDKYHDIINKHKKGDGFDIENDHRR
jgi:hypothetical protein